MTRWNSWFHSVEYIAEYLEALIEFLTGVDCGVSAGYFTILSNCERASFSALLSFLWNMELLSLNTFWNLKAQVTFKTAKPFLALLEISTLSKMCEKLFAVAKTLTIVTTLTQKEFLEGFLAFQAQTAKVLDEEPNVDVCQVLQGLNNDHANFVSQALAIVWIPASNVDCERGFSSYRHIFSDLHTGLKTSNIELC
ncbi:hypothetical protein PR048_002471 [Dryococelus australis]|uniref:HAT C-terminal dimerisation domain-containing protein n=1 Tax=Dryococelus australis TaxID=614101 RepID=A0ABQ9IK91_9NEOP|nr:hypothetical protein PR048_002471 [Dryococelus australis]